VAKGRELGKGRVVLTLLCVTVLCLCGDGFRAKLDLGSRQKPDKTLEGCRGDFGMKQEKGPV
jgi:hypothetical protein